MFQPCFYPLFLKGETLLTSSSNSSSTFASLYLSLSLSLSFPCSIYLNKTAHLSSRCMLFVPHLLWVLTLCGVKTRLPRSLLHRILSHSLISLHMLLSSFVSGCGLEACGCCFLGNSTGKGYFSICGYSCKFSRVCIFI